MSAMRRKDCAFWKFPYSSVRWPATIRLHPTQVISSVPVGSEQIR
ncbi:hypothetical protein ABT167_14230 [Streptomyces sp. NPDC001792]